MTDWEAEAERLRAAIATHRDEWARRMVESTTVRLFATKREVQSPAYGFSPIKLNQDLWNSIEDFPPSKM